MSGEVTLLMFPGLKSFQTEGHLYNRFVPRNLLRISLILLSVLLAALGPFLASGYSELKKASTASTYTEVAEHYLNAAQRIPWRADLYELSGHAYYHAQEYVKADSVYQQVSQRGALSSEGWVAWGDVNYLNNDPRRATDIWEQALQQKNPSEHLYSRLAEIYRSADEPAKAADYLEKYVSLHLEDALAHYRLGVLLTLSDPSRASMELIDASKLDPQLDSAAQTLRTALNLASLSDSASMRFVVTGRGLGLVNEWQLAHTAFESAVEADAKNAEAWAWLGEANQQMGLPDAGAAQLEHALSLDPKSSTVRGLRGLYFQRVGNFRQALTEFQSAAALEPENAMWHVSLGETQAKLGDLIRALEAYQTATRLAPEVASYWRLLAIFCAQNNVNIKDIGVPAAQKAVVLSGKDVTSLDVLGWLLMLDARDEEARQILSRALELDPQNSSVHLHWGMLALQTNDRVSAFDHLIQARDLGSQEAVLLLKQYFP